MRRYFSTRSSRRLSTAEVPSEKDVDANSNQPSDDVNDTQTTTEATAVPPAPVAPASLKIKRVDHYWSTWSKSWKYRNTGSGIVAEAVRPVGNGSDNDPWANFCFVVVRKIPEPNKQLEGAEITFQVVVKSPYLLKACKEVIGTVPGLSWTAEPLELDPQLLIAFFPRFEQYEKALHAKARTPEENHMFGAVGVLLEYLRKDYRGTLARIASLTAHGEITFDLLYAILVPRTTIVTECPVTGEPRALQILSATKIVTPMCSLYSLVCESIDSTEEGAHPGRRREKPPTSTRDRLAKLIAARTAKDRRGRAPVSANGNTQTTSSSAALKGRAFGRVQSKIVIFGFKGTEKINTLEAYPIQYHSDPEGLKALLLERGRKWASLKGIHHMLYTGTAALTANVGGSKKLLKYNVDSRVMIDRGNFIRLNPNYEMPKANIAQSAQEQQTQLFWDPNTCMIRGSVINLTFLLLMALYLATYTSPIDHSDGVPMLDVRTKHQEEEAPLTDEEYILASPILYGFSLSDKVWFEFNVEYVQPINWNEEAFEGLVLAADRKNLLRSLVDAHNADLGFDDFVQGKGQGLIINLFGPPGVGKTLSAEATSEHVRAPLYVVGGGDLGTKAADLDGALERVFDIATSWKAIVLIDEADVFLERRSLHDLERNAMVAVFLRHVEYYRGILFLTTNRITAFDEAFLSRIHVALNFSELSVSAKVQVWRSFLTKAGVSDFDDALVQKLAERDINGRQIKNACRTAQSLAFSRGESLGFAHLGETLDAMEEFTTEFAALDRVRAASAV
ncbi:P-loop containing nucleoside triphosphate hydrolase protein [Dichomitus squalens]|uniref:P-loop containing nucleoside triphosphate hydrolase protein n=1 Tax=Dichomitus squalens TaxID=114155 RepID=A0A4Q9MR96_9APHY|nr:P-loop containing nucleoside triphosphate hydrolase protein [Dichomitus squalens]